MKLRELRPCDNCGKPIGQLFHVIKYSFAVVDQRALREFFGLTIQLGSEKLAEVMGAHQDDAVKFLAEEKGGPGWRPLFVCNDCFCGEINIALMLEKLTETEAKTEASE